MTLTESIIKKIIIHLLKGEDYRIEIISLINAEFLQYAIDFFRKIVDAKLNNRAVSTDWYADEFLDPRLSSDELTIHSGLNKKTISNMYNSARREIVIEATKQHYEHLYQVINSLVEQGSDIDITLTIKFRGCSVDLNVNESLIVINSLAVKRAELRGGAWSTAGKRIEKILMLVLCKLYAVSEQYYEYRGTSSEGREVDFYLIGRDKKRYLCEVKLMGKGNPESADAVVARDSDIFVADKLSDLNKQQLRQRGVRWVELRSENGYRKIEEIFKELQVPFSPPAQDIEHLLTAVFTEIF
ncbi:MAG: CfrBI family restriction endonuclease [Anaerolineae bacterium]|nr:CfrBI family restriction endonuclease [Anaerolineae bacterium]